MTDLWIWIVLRPFKISFGSKIGIWVTGSIIWSKHSSWHYQSDDVSLKFSDGAVRILNVDSQNSRLHLLQTSFYIVYIVEHLIEGFDGEFKCLTSSLKLNSMMSGETFYILVWFVISFIPALGISIL